MNTVKLADAKAHLSELVSQVEAGDAINMRMAFEQVMLCTWLLLATKARHS